MRFVSNARSERKSVATETCILFAICFLLLHASQKKASFAQPAADAMQKVGGARETEGSCHEVEQAEKTEEGRWFLKLRLIF